MEEVPIDLEYNKAKRFKGFKRLPFVIYTTPKKKDNEKIGLEENYKLLNDNFIKEFVPSDKEGHKTDIYMYGGITLFFGVIMPIAGSAFEKGFMEVWVYIVYLILALFFGKITHAKWKKHKLAPESSYMLLDRQNSLITLPRIGDFEFFKIPFIHLRADITRIVTRSTFSAPLLNFYRDYSMNFVKMHDARIILGGWHLEAKQAWSFYVWYMDKNRPLPPGNNFDAYRQKDFERRKAEGFPPPLFKSLVPTPEATAEQQLVREAFWKDVDYVPTEQESFYSLWKPKPKDK